MKENHKKKKNIWKKIGLIGGITFLVLLISILLIPVFFKDQIKELALNEANKMLKADVAIGDFDLTIFSTFPKMKLTFNDVSITGREEFEGVKLVDVKTLEARLDFWSVINMENIGIRSIHVIEPNIHVQVLETGVANYDIVKTSEELAAEEVDTTSTPFQLSLSFYEIKKGYIIYDDRDTISPMYAKIDNLNHSGKGDITAEIIDFKTETTLENLLFTMGKTMRVDLKDLYLDGDGALNAESSDFVINTTIGELQYKEGNSMKANLENFKTKGIIDYSPETIDLKTMISSEELSFVMDGLAYLSKVKTDLDLDLVMDFSEESSKFTLKENSLKLNALALSFDGYYEMFENHDEIDFKLNAGNTTFKELLSLVPAFYHTGYESMVAQGSMSLNGFVKGRLDAINLPAWDFGAKVSNASIVYPDVKAPIENINIVAGSTFSGGADLDKMTIDVDLITANFAGNTIDANFYLRNPMTDPHIRTKLDAYLDLSTLDQVYPLDDEYVGKLTSDLAIEGRMSDLENERYDNFNATGTVRLQDFVYNEASLNVPLKVSNVELSFTPQQLKLVDAKARLGESDFAMNGDIKNYMGYLLKENEELKGNFNFNSNYLNVDEIMPPSTETTSVAEDVEIETEETPDLAEEVEAILVPKNIDFTLNTKINKIKYDGMNIEDLSGKITLKDEVASLENLQLKALGGSVGLNGKYNTVNHSEPKVDFNWSLKELDIQQLTSNFLTVEMLAPIAKYTEGTISSDFAMTSSLTPSFSPIFNTLSGFGSLFSSQITISGFKPMEKLAEAIDLDKLKSQSIDNFHAYFEFNDGQVKVKPFNVKLGKMDMNVQGTTSFEQDINYELNMMIPKEELPKSVIDVAEKAIAQANKIPGFKMKELPAEIPVTAFVTNTITDPKIKTNLKEKLMELGGDVKEQISDLVDDKVEEVKDSVRAVIDEQVDKAREELEKRKQELLDEAQKQADNVVEEAKKLADRTRVEADNSAKKLINEAGSNPLRKAAAEAAAKKLREEGEKTAKKIESEAQKQADEIMKRARERANNLD